MVFEANTAEGFSLVFFSNDYDGLMLFISLFYLSLVSMSNLSLLFRLQSNTPLTPGISFLSLRSFDNCGYESREGCLL